MGTLVIQWSIESPWSNIRQSGYFAAQSAHYVAPSSPLSQELFFDDYSTTRRQLWKSVKTGYWIWRYLLFFVTLQMKVKSVGSEERWKWRVKSEEWKICYRNSKSNRRQQVWPHFTLHTSRKKLQTSNFKLQKLKSHSTLHTPRNTNTNQTTNTKTNQNY